MYSKKEEFLNTLTHFFGLILTIIGIPFMLYFNNDYTEYSLFSIMLFLFGLFCVYLTSTIYHYTTNKKLKSMFQKLDHISIFYLICGSYAPVCLITLYDGIGFNIFISVFLISVAGTLFKIFYTGKYERASLFLYLAMGWLIVVDIQSVLKLIDFNGIILLVLSGIFYSVGTIFYSMKKMKFSHSIWHVLVLLGSACHYFVILLYVI